MGNLSDSIERSSSGALVKWEGDLARLELSRALDAWNRKDKFLLDSTHSIYYNRSHGR